MVTPLNKIPKVYPIAVVIEEDFSGSENTSKVLAISPMVLGFPEFGN